MNDQTVDRRAVTPRSTRQKRAVAAALAASDDFRAAQEIHDSLRRGGDSVGLATVYRTLQSLVDLGEVDMVKTDGGEAVYRRCSPSHHHHLVCRHCGGEWEIGDQAMQAMIAEVATHHDFRVDTDHLVLFGECASCRG